MSVLIKDMEMPQNCGDCSCARIFDGYTCMAAKRSFDKYPLENRMDWCPLIDVPEPHGRLIDADAMITSVKRQAGFLKSMGGDLATTAEILEKGILQEIENAPTVIPASEEG